MSANVCRQTGLVGMAMHLCMQGFNIVAKYMCANCANMKGVFLRKNYHIFKKLVTVIFLRISLRSGLIEDGWIFISAFIFNLLQFF